MENNNTSPRSHESMNLYKWMALILFAASLVKLVPYWFFIIPLAVDWGFDFVVFVFGPAYKEYRLLQKERRKHKELLNAFSSPIDSIVEAKAKSRDFVNLKALRNEAIYRAGWEANIAVAFQDAAEKAEWPQTGDGMIVHLYKNGKFDAAIEQWEQRRAEKNNIEKDKTKNKIVVTGRTELLSMATQVIEPKKEYDLDGFFRDTVSESEYYALKEMGNGFMIRGSRLTNTQILWLATNGVIEVPF